VVPPNGYLVQSSASSTPQQLAHQAAVVLISATLDPLSDPPSDQLLGRQFLANGRPSPLLGDRRSGHNLFGQPAGIFTIALALAPWVIDDSPR
jgi:hypothetical protein